MRARLGFGAYLIATVRYGPRVERWIALLATVAVVDRRHAFLRILASALRTVPRYFFRFAVVAGLEDQVGAVADPVLNATDVELSVAPLAVPYLS